MSKNTIFVQIASYRDPELLNTLRSLFDNARYPNNLRIGLAWQRDENESLEEFAEDKRLTVLDIPYKDAKGVCWARNLIQYLYAGEKYTLQLDSHHIFEKHWDVTLINMVKKLQKKGHKKPLITSYIPHFDPKTGEKVLKPWKLNFQRFLVEGPAFPVPETIDNFEELKEPLPGRFYSAHFAFTLGEFCKEVPHDPDFYFHGEEPSIAARAFTWGYDIFHPHVIVAWHEYTRNDKTKHWDDNEWVERNNKSYKKYRQLFSIGEEVFNEKEFGRYGFGPVRTLEDYKRYAGVDLSNKTAQDWAMTGQMPPGPEFESEEEYLNSFNSFNKHVANVHQDEIDPNADYDFWAIIFKDKTGIEVHRRDADERELKGILRHKEGEWYQIWREWYGSIEPVSYVVWPHSKTLGWMNPIVRNI